MTAYGAAVRHSEFSMAAGWAFTNNGSVGITPKAILEERRQLLERFESNPDRFVRQVMSDLWLDNLRATCEYLNLPFEHCAFVDNTTTGVNDVLNSFPFRAGDRILTTSLVYGAVHFACETVAEKKVSHPANE